MNNYKYILDGHTPVRCDDLLAWGRWFEDTSKRIVKKTQVGRYLVSTVFLGLDHGWGEKSPPVLFETMVFDTWSSAPGGDLDCERYSTWDEAEQGHDRIVEEWVKKE